MSIQCVYTIYTQNVYTPIHTIQNNQQKGQNRRISTTYRFCLRSAKQKNYRQTNTGSW